MEITLASEKHQSWQYVSQGEMFIEQGKIKEAELVCHQAITLYPDDAGIYRILGIVEEKKGNWKGVIENYRKAISIDSQQPVWVYLVLARLLNESCKWGESSFICEQVINLYPDNAEAHRYLGLCAEKLGDKNAEILSYQKAIQFDSSQPAWVYKTLINRLEKIGDKLAATKVAKQALKIYSQQSDFLSELHRLQNTESNAEEAESLIDSCKDQLILGQTGSSRAKNCIVKSLNENPVQPVEIYERCSQLLRNSLKFEEAVRLCDKGIQLYPESSSLYIQRGISQEILEDFSGQIVSYRKAISLESNQPEWVYLTLGERLRKGTDFEERTEVYLKLVRQYPDSIKGLRNLQRCLVKLKWWNKALYYSKKLVLLEPNSASNYYTLGNILSSLKKWDEAFLAYKKSSLLNPEYFDIYMQLAIVAFQQGKYEDCICSCREVIRLNPASFTAYQFLNKAVNYLDESVTEKYLDGLPKDFSRTRSHSIQLIDTTLQGRCVMGNVIAHPTAMKPFGLAAVVQVGDARYGLEINFHQKFSRDAYSAKTFSFRASVPLEIMTDHTASEVSIIIFDSHHQILYQGQLDKQHFLQPCGVLESSSGIKVWGWAWDPSMPDSPVDIDIKGEGNFQCRVQANRYRRDLYEAGLGNGCHMFELTLDHEYQKNLIQEMSINGKYLIDIRDFKREDSTQKIGRISKISARPSHRITLR